MIGSLPTASALLTINPCNSTELAPIVTLKKLSSMRYPSSTVVCSAEGMADLGPITWIDAVVDGTVDDGTDGGVVGAGILLAGSFLGLTSLGSGAAAAGTRRSCAAG